MKKFIISLMVAAAAVLGVVASAGVGTAGQASAAVVTDTPTKVFVGFTKGETKDIARSGVAGVLDHPAVRNQYYASVDRKTRFKRVYIPGRGYATVSTANKLVREAAAHNGNVWISFNKTGARPLTLWTRW